MGLELLRSRTVLWQSPKRQISLLATRGHLLERHLLCALGPLQRQHIPAVGQLVSSEDFALAACSLIDPHRPLDGCILMS